MEEKFNFGEALKILKEGCVVCREGWNGKGMWLKLITPESIDVFEIKDCNLIYKFQSFIGIKTADNKFIPWQASQSDMLAEDWTYPIPV